jgi:hypothetical protein
LHDHETDMMHVVHGSATVTGWDERALDEGGVLVTPNGARARARCLR